MTSADALTPHGLVQAAQNSPIIVPMAMRLGDALAEATPILAQAGAEAPRREARLLAAHCLGVSASALLDPAVGINRAAFFAAVSRRAAREPLAFITGCCGFWTLDLAVSPATLVPRADSEALIEAALAAFPARAGVRRILDLGTGTVCLLLAALSEFPAAFGAGLDRSAAAARLAAHNAKQTGLDSRSVFLVGDWAAAIGARFDLVLCNPPYIETAAIAGLMPEVAAHEPASALDGGADGLDAYRLLMQALPALLSPGGAAIVELGAGQGDAVAGLARQAGLIHVSTQPDFGGVPRALTARPGIRP